MNVYELTIRQAADALRKKELSSEELVSGLLKRIDDKEPQIRALNFICREAALDDAREVELVLGAAAVPQDDADEEPAVPYDTTQEEGDA